MSYMDKALEITRTVAVIVEGILVLFLLVKVNHLISITTKNNETMASLQEFQAQADRIKASADQITNLVQNQGMSAADQDAALQAVTEAADKLASVVPAPPAQEG